MTTVVLGGGLIGLASAHELLRDGHEVVIVDRGALGGGATPGNAGWVCPSQVTPLAAPGMVRHSAGLLLRPTSPLWIQPTANPVMLRFLLAFARRCNRRAFAEATAALAQLAETVEADYARLEDELGGTFTREHAGILSCFTDVEHARTAHQGWYDVARVSGTGPGDLLDADAMTAEEPALSREVVAGFVLPQDGHLDPTALAAALRSAVESAGAKVVEHAGACFPLRDGNRVVGVHTAAAGRIDGDDVVIAAGAGSAGYLRSLGIRVPMVAGTGYSFTVEPPVVPRRPLHLEEAHVACTPLGGTLRVAGTMEISRRESGINHRRVNAIAKAASRYVRDVSWDDRSAVWGGPRPVTSDGVPLLGRPEGIDGCVVATGHGMYGVTLAPTTGRLVAQLVGGTPTQPALSPSR
ncbi:MAG TPA: FAD-dependent oxidoreductase [Mycobacteriales bacterium]|nr:FAD-dependent oxidoreductase [Mycobacteriales bacterium]